MAEASDDEIPVSVTSIYPPILLSILIGAFIYWAFDFGEGARRLPLLIGIGTLVLIVLDLLSRFDNKFGSFIHMALGAGFQDREMQHVPRWRSELIQLLWVAFCVSSMLLIGILPTIPLFVFLYMLLAGKQTWGFSLMISLVIVFIIATIFEIVLEYDLYRGMLFNQDGY